MVDYKVNPYPVKSEPFQSINLRAFIFLLVVLEHLELGGRTSRLGIVCCQEVYLIDMIRIVAVLAFAIVARTKCQAGSGPI